VSKVRAPRPRSCEAGRGVVRWAGLSVRAPPSPLSPRDTPPATLAPPPDFRYVGLEVHASRRLRVWVGLVGAGALAGTAIHGTAGALVGALLGAGAAGAGAAMARVASFRGAGAPDRSRRAMAIVPWGVMIDFEDGTRILRWPGVVRVRVDSVHGQDLGTPITHYSVVTVETPRDRYVGRAPGTPPLERLTVHLEEYAREASHRIALDLDGARSGEGPSEPDVELVLSAARAYLTTSAAARRLDLAPQGGYREAGGKRGSELAARQISDILRDRTARDVDPRPFAAAVAAELDLTAVGDDLVELVQSPLPILAAVAKVAATRLGVARARVGTLEEVEPFLLQRDVEALAAWQGA